MGCTRSEEAAAAAGGDGAAAAEGAAAPRKPGWLRVAVPHAGRFRATAALMRRQGLHTVCEEARCPNRGECFSAGTATVLILGDACTRSCRFCAVGGGDGRLLPPDPDEPRRVAAAARELGLRHVVVTSVTRDDLADGGAGAFAATIAALRAEVPAATVEVLVPDFGGDERALATVLAAGPDVLAHNLETVSRLYADVRPGADYRRSLALLARAAAGAAGRRPRLKTGLMLGLGETAAEVAAVLADAAAAGVDVVTLGQYLRPARDCLPVARYVPPGEFARWEEHGRGLGLRVVAGPLVRSSYHAAEVAR